MSRATRSSILGLCVAVGALAIATRADETKTDPRYPFRTDFANAQRPWYQPKPGEFPPHHSDHRVGGELVSEDFIHRSGQFRDSKTGQLIDFVLPEYGSINYLNADADLRDVPLGTFFLFFLNQDSKGGFTRLATMQDQFTMDAGHGFSYRLDELKLAEGKLLTTRQKLSEGKADLGRKELVVNDSVRIWKGNRQIKLSDLSVGDSLLFNLTGKTATSPGHCTDIWVGAETQKLSTEQQRKKFAEFIKARGLPGWIDQDEGDKLTVTLFSGDSNQFQKTWLGELTVGSEIKVVVANDELRTWNPPVDNERGELLAVEKTSTDVYGTSGVRLKFRVANMLEGFRKGRVVRIFARGWPLKDPPFGEGLMNYGDGPVRDAEIAENLPKEYPLQFPFRTDFGNEQLPWYQLKPGVIPPRLSEHLVLGELTKVDAGDRSGQFRTDRTGEVVNFSLISEGAALHPNTKKPEDNRPAQLDDVPASVRYLDADAVLSDVPIGTRCRFHLYQDANGKFTRASLVTDEFSYLAENVVSYRIDSIKLDEGKLQVARQIPEVKNYNGDMVQPPDLGRTELLINPDTRVWKESQQVKPSDLSVGDSILVNVSGEEPDSFSHCTEIWAGTDAQKRATDRQRERHSSVRH